jgi:CheY-like chemotaxis protein
MSRYFSSWRIDAIMHATAAEGEVAWQAAVRSQRPFDVAIIDVKGLGCDGIKLARKMRAAADDARPEVVLLIALDGSIADSSLESVGAFALLPKPPRPSVLFDCLASIASGAREHGVASFYVRKSGRPEQITFDARTSWSRTAINRDVATVLENMAVPSSRPMAVGGRNLRREQFDLILMDCEMPVRMASMREATAISRSRDRPSPARAGPSSRSTAHGFRSPRALFRRRHGRFPREARRAANGQICWAMAGTQKSPAAPAPRNCQVSVPLALRQKPRRHGPWQTARSPPRPLATRASRANSPQPPPSLVRDIARSRREGDEAAPACPTNSGPAPPRRRLPGFAALRGDC